MAQCLADLAPEYPDLSIVAQVSRSRPDSGRFACRYFDSLEAASSELEGEIDLLVDFSLPDGTLAAARWCAEGGIALLSGVTGLPDQIHSALDETSRFAPVLWASNLSPGINLLASLLDEVAGRIDGETKVTISEVHHAGKKDAPSGTALELARHIRPLPGGADHRRRPENFTDIVFESRREGEVAGDHSVLVEMPDESFTFSHHAENRRLFARGAIEAGLWLARQAPGRYSAADWIRNSARPAPSGGES